MGSSDTVRIDNVGRRNNLAAQSNPGWRVSRHAELPEFNIGPKLAILKQSRGVFTSPYWGAPGRKRAESARNDPEIGWFDASVAAL